MFGSVFNLVSSPAVDLLKRGRVSLLKRIFLWIKPRW